MTTPLKTRAARARAGAFLAGAGIAVAATTAVVLHHDEPATRASAPNPASPTTGQYAGPTPTPPGQPCPGATLVDSVLKLVSLTTTPIYAPVGKTPTNLWVCGSNPALAYGTLEVNFEAGWSDVDAKTKMDGLAAENGGEVQTILGQPAWVRPGSTDGTWPLVEFVLNGTLVNVLAPADVPVSELVALAKTIPTVPTSGASL